MLMLRQPVQRNRRKQQVITAKPVPAPTEGWDASAPLANMRPQRAVQLKNFFPQPGWVEPRKGFRRQGWALGSSPKTVTPDATANTFTSTAHGIANGTQVKFHAGTTLPAGLVATRVYYVIDTATDTFKVSKTSGGSAVDITDTGSGTITVYIVNEPSVETLAVWQGPSSSKMFAAAGNAIWDVTASGAGTFSYGTALTNNRWQHCMHTTSGGNYLFMVNGVDGPLHYNGSTWAIPTINNITEANAIQVISHKKRLWFVMASSTKAAYLATEAIAGDATVFEVGSEFTKGGYLNAIASWSRDGGAGMDDMLVFISSEGQCVIYQGTDPASPTTWAKVGTFDLAKPIGRRCFHKYGADLLVLTVSGVMPLSKLLAVDASVDDLVAVTQRINSAFNTRATSSRNNFGWELCVYDQGTRLIVNIPTSESVRAVQYVMNTLTQAWCEFEGMNANCWAVYNSNLYFGGNDGEVYRADTGSTDLDTPIRCVGQTAYTAFGSANLKQATQLRPLITTSGSNRPSLGVSVDFSETKSMAQLPTGASGGGNVWNGAGLKWNQAGLKWGGGTREITDWANVGALGMVLSVKFAVTTGQSVGGGPTWGTMTWNWIWGSQGRVDETMRINGFVLHYQPGGPQ